jgi:hypothetical protein
MGKISNPMNSAEVKQSNNLLPVDAGGGRYLGHR